MTAHRGTRVWGTDRIVPRGDKLVVYSNVDMHDWQVRRYRRPAIIVDGVTYFVAKRETGENKEIRYVLEPWPESFRDLAGRRIHYDEEYVRARDAARAQMRRRDLAYSFLLALKPFIGLMPSATKLRIEAKFGISARSATFFSLWLEICIFLALGVLVSALAYANMYAIAASGTMVGPYLLLRLILVEVALLVDLIMRYSSYLREDPSPCGFYEWIFPRRSS